MSLERTVKTSQDAANDVFKALVNAGVKSAVNMTGKIYQDLRPADSELEDIVVSTLAMSADQMQEGVINVNVHVPNLTLTNDNTQPNSQRFDVIVKGCLSVLDSMFGFDYNFEVEEPGILVRDGLKWFSNIRVRYYYSREDITA